MSRKKRWWLRGSVAALGGSVLPGWGFAQCEMCKTGLTNSAEGLRLLDGFRSGILLLIAMPYVLFGTLALVIFWIYRRHDARNQSPAPPGTE